MKNYLFFASFTYRFSIISLGGGGNYPLEPNTSLLTNRVILKLKPSFVQNLNGALSFQISSASVQMCRKGT
jgi:hypothetical protein